MFKSIFAKYVTVFMLIILVCFSMLTGIISFSINSFSEDIKGDFVRSSAASAESYLESRIFRDGGPYSSTESGVVSYDIVEFITDEFTNTGEVMRAVAAFSEGSSVFITDNAGQVLLLADSSVFRKPDNVTVPANEFYNFNHDIDLMKLDRIDGIFDSEKLVTAIQICDSDGIQAGCVFVCAPIGTYNELQNLMLKTVVMASLWVMVAALIAVYFITDRVIGPLKQMGRAAKSFAKGDFSVRVPVKGHDEVAELAMAFNNMAKSLESSEKMRVTFMANVSHDLRTPMTTISGFIDGILAGAIPPEKYEYYLGIIANEVRRLSRLVTQLLDVSRLEAGDRKFNKQRFDVCEMARQILISFEQKIDAKNLDVNFDVDEDNMYAFADRDAIYQILYNICDNAIKFSYERGKLEISVKSGENGKINVSVYNEGQGISTEDLPYVFERFYKSDKSRGLDKMGVGLGLYISRTIIEAHNEKIKVESEEGKFCRFTFTLSEVKEKQ